MNLFHWLTGHFTNRGKALSVYKRGMVRAKKHDHQGAIDDYTTAIFIHDTPADVKAMALYNRALVYAATEEGPKATEDLKMLLAMDQARVNVKAMARQKLARMETRSRKSNLEIPGV